MTTQALQVVAVLLSNPTDQWYGFELVEKVGLKSGTVYPLLARFEQAGWLESRWEDVDPRVAGRPRRRLYALTAVGATAASDAVNAHLDRVPRPSKRGWIERPEVHPA